ncbi:MAG TPA: SUMF1/EgtB/PvdO family nonheme iron enzyme [Gemmatimonadaceae bacterium]|nr:SUMF1/EgtB/PvdO family nonheme iron enzyme [Gemmatimonadaceae bacterium]
MILAGLSGSGILAPRDASAQLRQNVIRDSISGTLVTFEMVLVPPTVGKESIDKAFYIGRTEVTWDMYDVFMNRLDTARAKGPADALARPSQPYAVPDYDWGHAGFAAISISYHAANAFAEWLSVKTGHRYRLPTEAEWERVARIAAGGTDVIPRHRLDSLAWHRDNSGDRANAVASKQPDNLGLHDLFGNAAEWVHSDRVPPVTRGGSFRDDPATMGPASRAPQSPRWTERDPQLPSSRWWLTDGPFVGFRLVREP